MGANIACERNESDLAASPFMCRCGENAAFSEQATAIHEVSQTPDTPQQIGEQEHELNETQQVPAHRPELVGQDQAINDALELNPLYQKLREQITNFMEQQRYWEDDEVASKQWNAQVTHAQELFVKRLISDFGEARAKPYIDSYRKYWNQQCLNLKRANSTRLDCNLFFEYFCIDSHGDLIYGEEFPHILEVVDQSLAHKDDLAHGLFMFLDQSRRGSFNRYDLECFFGKIWGGDIGEFQKSVIKFLKTTHLTKEETKRFIKKEVKDIREKEQLSIAYSQLSVLDYTTQDEDNVSFSADRFMDRDSPPAGMKFFNPDGTIAMSAAEDEFNTANLLEQCRELQEQMRLHPPFEMHDQISTHSYPDGIDLGRHFSDGSFEADIPEIPLSPSPMSTTVDTMSEPRYLSPHDGVPGAAFSTTPNPSPGSLHSLHSSPRIVVSTVVPGVRGSVEGLGSREDFFRQEGQRLTQ